MKKYTIGVLAPTMSLGMYFAKQIENPEYDIIVKSYNTEFTGQRLDKLFYLGHPTVIPDREVYDNALRRLVSREPSEILGERFEEVWV